MRRNIMPFDNRENIHRAAKRLLWSHMGFPGGAGGQEAACQCRRLRDWILIPGSGQSPGGGQPTLVFLPGESHG